MTDRREFGALLVLLVLLGAGWGLTIPLAKIAVSGGYRHFGLIFWQLLIGAILLGAIVVVRRRRFPVGRRQVTMAITIALLGTIFPNAASYQAAVHLPAGVISILIALTPLFALPIAFWFGIDRPGLWRLTGLALGLAGVALIVGPQASLPEAGMAAWVPLALVAPFFYALEGNVIARFGTAAMDPIGLVFLASAVGVPLAAFLALATGQFIDPRPPWRTPDAALVLSSIVHAAVYTFYVWLVGRAGSVFAAQVSYLVTGFGVLWSMTLLGEGYSGYVWAALALMFVGLALVQPRPPLAVVATPDKDPQRGFTGTP